MPWATFMNSVICAILTMREPIIFQYGGAKEKGMEGARR